MFPEELIEHSVADTTTIFRNASLQLRATNGSKQHLQTEMKAFIGLHMLFSIKQLPATRLY